MEEGAIAREIREKRGEGRETYTKNPIDRHTDTELYRCTIHKRKKLHNTLVVLAMLKDFIKKRDISDLENQGRPNEKMSICSDSFRMLC